MVFTFLVYSVNNTQSSLLYIIPLWFLLFLILVTYYLVFDIVLTLDQQMVPQFFAHFGKGNQSKLSVKLSGIS